MADTDQDDECAICGGPLASDGVCADNDCGDDDPPAAAVDLMAALKESLDQAKKRRLAWADRPQATPDSHRSGVEES